MSISTYQDALDHWRATISDADGNTIASTPSENEYGYGTETEARQAAQSIVDSYQKSYKYNR